MQAAVEEGIVVGGGCTLLRLSLKVDAIKETLENDEEKVNVLAGTWGMFVLLIKLVLQLSKEIYNCRLELI